MILSCTHFFITTQIHWIKNNKSTLSFCPVCIVFWSFIKVENNLTGAKAMAYHVIDLFYTRNNSRLQLLLSFVIFLSLQLISANDVYLGQMGLTWSCFNQTAFFQISLIIPIGIFPLAAGKHHLMLIFDACSLQSNSTHKAVHVVNSSSLLVSWLERSDCQDWL